MAIVRQELCRAGTRQRGKGAHGRPPRAPAPRRARAAQARFLRARPDRATGRRERTARGHAHRATCARSHRRARRLARRPWCAGRPAVVSHRARLPVLVRRARGGARGLAASTDTIVNAVPPRTVVHFSDSDAFGGTERALLQLVAGLDRTLWRPVVFHADAPGAAQLASESAALGARTVAVERGSTRLRGVASIVPLARALQRERADVFHAHQTWSLSC
ncbi:MAG: hypothetical protein DMD35_21705, partial [Gemmatimonadetes bacterium]